MKEEPQLHRLCRTDVPKFQVLPKRVAQQRIFLNGGCIDDSAAREPSDDGLMKRVETIDEPHDPVAPKLAGYRVAGDQAIPFVLNTRTANAYLRCLCSESLGCPINTGNSQQRPTVQRATLHQAVRTWTE